MSLSIEEAFYHFDKGSKGFLTQHELKCAVAYITGSKLRYDHLKSIWADKDKYYSEKDLNSKGINLKYLKHVLRVRKDIYPDEDQRLELEFQSIDTLKRGRINFQQFNELFETFGIRYMNDKVRESIFAQLDYDKDGFISLQDYKNLMGDH